MSTYYQMPNSYTLTGVLGADTYVIELTLTPGSQASFHGVQAMTIKQTGHETKNGAAFRDSTSTLYVLTAPFTEIGVNTDNNVFELDSNQQSLPELASPVKSGPLGDQKYYSDSGFNTQVGSGTRTWTLAALTSDTARFCIHDTNTVSGVSDTEIDCYDLDMKGNVTAIQITFESGGQSITFK